MAMVTRDLNKRDGKQRMYRDHCVMVYNNSSLNKLCYKVMF